jgi:TetR/AcrR family transcriptional regulator
MSFKKEKEVLLAALHEFSQYSYEDSSLNSIIKKSGISKGSFYHHFKNKYDIYIYVLKDSVTKKWEFINEQGNTCISNNIIEILKEQIRIGIEFGNKYPIYSSLSEKFKNEKDTELYNRVINDLGINEREGLNKLIIDSFNKGQFNEYYSLEFILNLMNYFFISHNNIFNNYEMIDQFIYFLNKGLGV